MEKKSFVLYASYIEQVELLTVKQRGVLFTAILQYANGRELPEMDAFTVMAFSFIKNMMDIDIKKYEDLREKRSAAGKKGGAPKGNKNASKTNDEINSCFERLWEKYPKKEGKSKITEAKKRELYEIGEKRMIEAIDFYKEELLKNPWRTPQNGGEFFTRGYLDYMDPKTESEFLRQRDYLRRNSI